MLFYCVLLTVLKYSWASPVENIEYRRVSRQHELETCFTPDNQPGNCIILKNCTSLQPLVKSLDETIKKYLQQSFCGRNEKDGYPKVCCPLTNDPIPIHPSIFKASDTEGFTMGPSPPVTPTPPSVSTGPAHADSRHRHKDFSKCGLTKRIPTKIVGGQESSLGDWPWMAALYYRTRSESHPSARCGGTLISKEWVVTAAHCFSDGNLIPAFVRLGDLNLNDSVADGANPVDVPIAEVIMHPQFTSRPPVNDIALIRLKNPVEFSELIRPACLFNESEMFRTSEFYQNKMPFIMGWGKVNYEGPASSTLQEASVKVIDRDTCARNYANHNVVIDDRVLCAGGKNKDTCKGDSGGPLIIALGGMRHYLAGVVSFGVGCGDDSFPGVYTKVVEFTSWIAGVTQLKI